MIPDKAQEVWQRHVEAGMAREQRLLAVLAPGELDQLNDLLRKVVRSLDG